MALQEFSESLRGSAGRPALASCRDAFARFAVRFVAFARHPRMQGGLIGTLLAAYGIIWTLTLSILKWPLDLHSDSTEAFAWGQSLALGYAKHPPFSAWIARLWFEVFPTTNWAMYALAVATHTATLALAWAIARRMMDSRRALLAMLLLMVYPILNLKGEKYNPDLLQLPMLLLVVWTFLATFETRKLGWAVALGMAAAAAVLTKYWAVLVLAAVAIATLVHPDRLRFLRTPAPYVAGAVFLLAMTPHLVWLVQSDFASLTYAGGHAHGTHGEAALRAGKSLLHHGAMLIPLAAAFALALRGTRGWWSGPAPGGVRVAVARHVWVILPVLVLLPALLAVVVVFRTKSDWGIPLFTLAPLVLVSIPRLQVSWRSVSRGAAIAVAFALAVLCIAPFYVLFGAEAARAQRTPLSNELAIEVTRLWHARFHSPLPLVAAAIDPAANISFHSPDHPVMFSNISRRFAPWVDLDELKRTGFVGLCREGKTYCEEDIWALADNPERIVVPLRRTVFGKTSAEARWIVFLQGPAAPAAPASP